MKIITLLTDGYLFWIAEIIIFLLLVVGYFRVRQASGFIVVKRGLDSWSYFPLAFTVISTIWIQIIGVARVSCIEGYKVVISILNLVAIIYLCFFNGWFRNKIIGVIGRVKEKPENLA